MTIRPPLLAVTLSACLFSLTALAESPVADHGAVPPPAGIDSAKLDTANKAAKPNSNNPLSLNPAQQKERASLRNDQIAFQRQIFDLEGQLLEVTYSESFDKAKADNLAKQIAKITETYQAEHARKSNAFYKTLSPEQKKQMKAFEERRRKMQERVVNGGHPPAAMQQSPRQSPPAQGGGNMQSAVE